MVGSFKQKPWGYEKILAHEDGYVVKEIFVKAGAQLSLQYHEEKVESMTLVHGKGAMLYRSLRTCRTGEPGKLSKMVKFRPYFIRPGRVHRLCATTEDIKVIEVSSDQLDDVVRLEDDYGRV